MATRRPPDAANSLRENWREEEKLGICADKLAAQTEGAPTPFLSHVRDALAEHIRKFPPPPASVPTPFPPAFSDSGSRWRTPTLDALGAGAGGAYPIRAEQGVSVASKKSPPPGC